MTKLLGNWMDSIETMRAYLGNVDWDNRTWTEWGVIVNGLRVNVGDEFWIVLRKEIKDYNEFIR